NRVEGLKCGSPERFADRVEKVDRSAPVYVLSAVIRTGKSAETRHEFPTSAAGYQSQCQRGPEGLSHGIRQDEKRVESAGPAGGRLPGNRNPRGQLPPLLSRHQ